MSEGGLRRPWLLPLLFLIAAVVTQDISDGITLLGPEKQGPADVQLNYSNDNNIWLLTFLENAPTPFPILRIPKSGVKKPTHTVISNNGDQLDQNIALKDGYWVLYVGKKQDYENPQVKKGYMMTVGYEFTAQVSIKVININDNPPVITTDNTICTIKENWNGTSSCDFTVTDPDEDYENMTFEIMQSGQPSDIFGYIQSSVSTKLLMNLTVNKNLDYETKNIYSLDITVMDGNFSADLPIVIKVQDMPDEPPVWTTWNTIYTIPENEKFNVTLKATDGDVGVNDQILYKFNSTFDIPYFHLNEITGVLLVDPIDRDIPGNDRFEFSVIATEKNPPSTEANFETPKEIIFMIQDVDDNTPKFNVHYINISMDENSSTLKMPEIYVVDPDMSENGTFSVDLKSEGSGPNYSLAFSVVPNQGYQNANFTVLVVNPSLLDYENETWRHIHMTLDATEVANTNHTDKLELYIELNNVNDVFPKFNQTQFTASVKENVEKGHLITTLTATDADGDIDSITYSTTSSSVITINSKTGEVRAATNNAFDYELQKEVPTTVVATDLVGHSTYAQLNIRVIDVDDVAPTLHMPSARVVILENATVGEAVPGIGMNATDPDTQANLLFRIDWESSTATKNGIPVDSKVYTNTFSILPHIPSCETTACVILIVAEELHWDMFDTITLNIIVRDNNTLPSLPDKAERSATLTVAIIDVNNHFPTINDISGLQVLENSNVGQTIGTVVATDKDFNQTFTYALSPVDDTPIKWVNITQDTGVLYVSSPEIDCDFRESDKLVYVLMVSDGQHMTLETLVIEVVDVNDESPKILNELPMNVSILENSKDTTPILRINATDKDRTAPYNVVSYLMDTHYPNSYFDIDIDNGLITVSLKDNAVLDRERQETYIIYINVRDNYNKSSDYDSNSTPGHVTLTLEDENDNKPIFNEIPENCQGKEFLESMQEGELLFSITALDIDKINTDYSKIEFEIVNILPLNGSKDPHNENISLFKIDTQYLDPNYQGNVITNWSLKGYFGKYNITIEAHDKDPKTPQKNYQTYTICIKDIDDNAPNIVNPKPNTEYLIFDTQELYQTIILDGNQDMPLFYATDADSGKNAEVTFSIIGTDYAMKYFDINSNRHNNTGQLVLWKKLDINEMPNRTFQLQINATDGGEQHLHNSTNIVIKVLTNEPHEPYFEKNDMSTNISENEITQFNFTAAIDVDNMFKPIEQQQPIYYFIAAGNKDLFELDKNTTTVRIVKGMDYETKHNHSILIKATNNENGIDTLDVLEGSNILNITIYVEDVNDCPPKFTQESYAGGITPDELIYSNVLQVKAEDPDTNDHVRYDLMWKTMQATGNLQNFSSSLSLNDTTGWLNLLFKPFTSMTGYFSFKIKATDAVGHNVMVPVQVYPITSAEQENFKFLNTMNYVENQKDEITQILTTNLNYSCNVNRIVPEPDSSGKATNYTNVITLFMDINSKLPVDASVIKQAVNIFQTKIKIKDDFSTKGLDWKDFSGNELIAKPPDDGLNQTILIGVSAVLATLVFLLLAAFFFKTRSLNRRLEALSQTRFGSLDSGLNRVNMNVPNTNQHALEGSNPVWNEEIENDDNVSQGSGDSDLVGIEDNPEFKPQDNVESETKIPNGIDEHHEDPNFSFGPAMARTPATEL